MSGRPDPAQSEAEHKLAIRKRMREIEQSIMARTPEHDLEPSLDRIAAVMELLGDPQHAFPVIHITGTNGKTSTTRMIERMLREMGLSTGRFTSPHLHNIRERIALNGNPIEAGAIPAIGISRDGRSMAVLRNDGSIALKPADFKSGATHLLWLPRSFVINGKTIAAYRDANEVQRLLPLNDGKGVLVAGLRGNFL